ncbi:MAG TPA: hypothetical protein VFD90_17945 [Gaiellales bacterium]|nr:hypothetical protein [Gaiellales bacterium]
MSLRRIFTWLVIAPLGIGLTTGLTITTTLLTQQPIGLASEPLSAGDALAPHAATIAARAVDSSSAHQAPAPGAHGGRAVMIQAATTQPATTTSPADPVAQSPATPATNVPAPVPQSAPTPPLPRVKPRVIVPARTPEKAASDEHSQRDTQVSDGHGSDNTGSDNSRSGGRDD